MTKISPDQTLPRSLTFWEYLSFNLTGLLVWQGTVDSLQANHWLEVAGGSSSYILRLLSQFPRPSTPLGLLSELGCPNCH